MFTVKNADAAIGAEITNVDLSKAVSEDEFSKLVNVLHDREVMVFRNQNLTPEQQISFSRRFGKLEVHVRTDKCRPGYPEIYRVSNIIENGKPIGSADAGFFWHSDLCYAKEPSRGSLLYAKEVPIKDGKPVGDTLFSSMTLAYAALSETTKRLLENKLAVNSFAYGYARERKKGAQRPPLTEEQMRKTPDVEHPVVRTHPFTGKKCLFVNEGYTTKILGLPEEQSASLLLMLYEHVKDPRFIYAHSWQVGDLLVWDNCATQHRAVADYELPLRRLMERTTIEGTAPY